MWSCVRSMRNLLVLVVLLKGCVSAKPTGPYATRPSSADLLQIKLAVSQQPHADHWIRRLVVVQPDKVDIEVGHADGVTGMSGTVLYVIKRDGKWVVDPHSGGAWAERTIITY